MSLRDKTVFSKSPILRKNYHIWPLISECTGPIFTKFSGSVKHTCVGIIILTFVYRSFKGRCNDNKFIFGPNRRYLSLKSPTVALLTLYRHHRYYDYMIITCDLTVSNGKRLVKSNTARFIHQSISEHLQTAQTRRRDVRLRPAFSDLHSLFVFHPPAQRPPPTIIADNDINYRSPRSRSHRSCRHKELDRRGWLLVIYRFQFRSACLAAYKLKFHGSCFLVQHPRVASSWHPRARMSR